MGIFAVSAGLVILASPRPLESPQRFTPEPLFLEEFGKAGQGKGFRWWGEELQNVIQESQVLEAFIAKRASGKTWTPLEITDLSRHILGESYSQKVSPLFVLSVIEVESGYQPRVVSNAGAIGMLQLLPATAEEVARQSGVVWTGPNLLNDPKTNIRLGLSYLNVLKKLFRNDPKHTLLAYNMGPNALRERINLGQEVSPEYFDRVMEKFDDYKSRARLPSARLRRWSKAWL